MLYKDNEGRVIFHTKEDQQERWAKTLNVPFLSAKAKSRTSPSCAINCVRAVSVGTSHIVHVVSMEHVPIMLGSTSFQSNDVMGAQSSLFLFYHSEKKKMFVGQVKK